MKQTQKGKSYWNETGAYNKEYSEFYKKLVPGMGEAETLNGELLRLASRLYYEYNNNGNMNARDFDMETDAYDCTECNGNGEIGNYDEEDYEVCGECGGSGVMEEEYEGIGYVNESWEGYIEFIRSYIPEAESELNEIENIISEGGSSGDYFNDENQNHYDRLVDKVMEYILTHDDVPLEK